MTLKQFNITSVEMGFGEVSEIEFEDINRAYDSLARISPRIFVKMLCQYV